MPIDRRRPFAEPSAGEHRLRRAPGGPPGLPKPVAADAVVCERLPDGRTRCGRSGAEPGVLVTEDPRLVTCRRCRGLSVQVRGRVKGRYSRTSRSRLVHRRHPHRRHLTRCGLVVVRPGTPGVASIPVSRKLSKITCKLCLIDGPPLADAMVSGALPRG